MKFKLYKNHKYKIILFIFIIFISSMTLNTKEGLWGNYKPPPQPVCYNCSYYNRWTRRCEPYCRGGQICNGKYCVCPGGKIWNGNTCVCPGTQIWNGNTCLCPSGQTWNRFRCECSNGTNWNGTECIDCRKKGQIWQKTRDSVGLSVDLDRRIVYN